jgi:two-component system, chemotaxis family, protein-glutamate methylesterase/glutaminase
MTRPSNPRSIDILVVDDSAVVRQSLREIIEADPAFRVLIAADPYEAVAVMGKTAPRAIVLDVDMPRMDGLTFLRKLMSQHPLPVVLVTDHPARGVLALELGALEVITKPEWQDAGGLATWAEGLRESLRAAVGRNDRRTPELDRPITAQPRHGADAVLARRPYQTQGTPTQPIIAIGASTGGVQALALLLSRFPKELPGIVIVQHMPGGFTTAFAERLDRDPGIALDVREAKSGDQLRPGLALVIPGHFHGVVRRAPTHFWIELVDGPPVCRHKPSVEVLFRSTAQSAGPRGCGVILTGMGDDGAGGLLEMREAGGWTIAQDEATSVVFGMPKEAIRRGAARQVLALDRIPGGLLSWAHGTHPG